MPKDDPFAGIHLSEQTGNKKIEQRLFDRQPAPQPPVPAALKPVPPQEPVSKGPERAAKPPIPQVETVATLKAKVTTTPSPKFDLGEQPLYKASFLFTASELEALEDLKLELRRDLDTKVTKNELIRSALHMLLEDHVQDGDKSYARRKIRGRQR